MTANEPQADDPEVSPHPDACREVRKRTNRQGTSREKLLDHVVEACDLDPAVVEASLRKVLQDGEAYLVDGVVRKA